MQTNTKFNFIKRNEYKDHSKKLSKFMRKLVLKRFRKSNKKGLDLEHQKGVVDFYY